VLVIVFGQAGGACVISALRKTKVPKVEFPGHDRERR
jgi:hypothetical protein